MDTYLDIFKKGSPPSSVAWGYPEMVQGFNSGSTGLLMQSQEVINTLAASTTLKPSQWTTAPVPVGPAGKATEGLSTAGWGVAKSSKHIAESMKLAEYLTSGARAIEFSKGNAMIPAITSASKDPYFTKGAWAAYVKMINTPETFIPITEPRNVSWWTEWAAKGDADMQSLLVGKMTTQELLDGWNSYWVDKWKSN
jgi:multiple sugar transport system substrate-binding protein